MASIRKRGENSYLLVAICWWCPGGMITRETV